MLISSTTDMTSCEDVLHDGDRRQVRQPKPRVSETFIALSRSCSLYVRDYGPFLVPCALTCTVFSEPQTLYGDKQENRGERN